MGFLDGITDTLGAFQRDQDGANWRSTNPQRAPRIGSAVSDPPDPDPDPVIFPLQQAVFTCAGPITTGSASPYWAPPPDTLVVVEWVSLYVRQPGDAITVSISSIGDYSIAGGSTESEQAVYELMSGLTNVTISTGDSDARDLTVVLSWRAG